VQIGADQLNRIYFAWQQRSRATVQDRMRYRIDRSVGLFGSRTVVAEITDAGANLGCYWRGTLDGCGPKVRVNHSADGDDKCVKSSASSATTTSNNGVL
jgi:hypothetical protein